MMMLLNASTQDATIQQQTQLISSLKKKLSASIQENTLLYDFSSVAYLIIDHTGVIQSANFQAALLIDRTRNQLIDTLFFKFIAFDSIARAQSSLDLLFKQRTKQTCEIELLQKNEQKKQVMLELVQIQDHLIRISLVDISRTQQLMMQVVELQKSFNIVNCLFQSCSDAIASLDSELTIHALNHAFSDLFSNLFSIKIQPSNNLGVALSGFPDLQQKIIAACHKACLGERASVLLESNHLDEHYYCHEIEINYFYNEYLKKNALIMCIKSLTHYKLEEIKQHKKQADISIACKTSTMGEMASVFAHEINQPLTAIIAYSRSCLYMMKDSVDFQKIGSRLMLPLEQMAEQAELAVNIINNMKNIMHDGNFYLEKTDVNTLIRESISILKYELLNFKFKIHLDLHKDIPHVMTNKIHIMQIILNLARNSIEAFQAVSEKKPELLIKTCVTNEHVVVHVIDNGPGIPPDVHARILKTYFTTKSQGTGLGLGICRSLIEAHGGQLSVHEHTKQGAWFSFTLPIL